MHRGYWTSRLLLEEVILHSERPRICIKIPERLNGFASLRACRFFPSIRAFSSGAIRGSEDFTTLLVSEHKGHFVLESFLAAVETLPETKESDLRMPWLISFGRVWLGHGDIYSQEVLVGQSVLLSYSSTKAATWRHSYAT